MYFCFPRPLCHDICKKQITYYIKIQLGCEKSRVAQKFKFPGGPKTDEYYLHHFLRRFLAFPQSYRCLKAANDVVIARWFAVSPEI